MKIAVPTREGVVDDHFGHCAYYTIVDIVEGKIILSNTQKLIDELSHQPTEAERISVLEDEINAAINDFKTKFM